MKHGSAISGRPERAVAKHAPIFGTHTGLKFGRVAKGHYVRNLPPNLEEEPLDMTALDLEGVREKIRKNMPAHLRTPVDPLSWLHVGVKGSIDAYLESRCGRYTVTKAMCQVSESDETLVLMYAAWRVPPARTKDGLAVMATPLGARRPDVKKAQELCDADWQKTGGIQHEHASA